MPITAENIVRHEIIGLKVRIAKSTDTSQKGLTGRVMDESYNTFVIETKNGEKTVAKKNAFFVFTLPNKTKVEVDGKILISRPEDRIKKKFIRW